MSLWAIIPVKPLRRGKSRLSGILSEAEREKLNYAMLENTLKVVTAVPVIDEVLIISRDPAALALTRIYGAKTVQEEGNPELNKAIRRATKVAAAFAAHAVIIIPADLPLINVDDLRYFISKSGNPPEIVIAPDRRSDGTNALLINPVDAIEYCYGINSCSIHIKQAEEKKVRVEICHIQSLALDVDLPEDYELMRQNRIPGFDISNQKGG
jgi:2-phospho-L-lactate/phosphoenolpyruvate guanylyltransferase